MDKGSGSTNELDPETVPIANPSSTAALSAGDTPVTAKSGTSQPSTSERPGTTSTADGASVTVSPPEPVQGLDVRGAYLQKDTLLR
jgi:hypothetical protein